MTTAAELTADLDALVADATERLASAADLDSVGALDAEYLGKKSAITSAKKQLGQLAPEDRKAAGQAINAARTSLEAVVADARARLAAGARAAQYEAERLDLSEKLREIRRGSLHLNTQARDRLEDVFVGMGFTVAEGPEVETAWYNFEALNIPEWHPARGSFDTIFVNLGEPEEVMLRSHTSPVQIRTMENQEPPIYIVAPGRTFRTDTADATHLPAFNQIEGLVIDRGITMGDLAGTIDEFVRSFFGGEVKTRLRPSYFPFTEPSAEFDISRPDGSWLELGGCGMVHPNVLRNCGIDPDEWQGFAFGFGIDRLAVMRYELDDIRELVNNDVRFLRQF
ncbi:MAG: phenylalanine--tRNA ligase subunit alpha [Actinomycetota bacterium]